MKIAENPETGELIAWDGKQWRPIEKEAQREAPGGFEVGLMDPIHGAAQLLTEALPKPVVEAGNELNQWLIEKGIPLAEIPEGGVSQMVREGEAKYQQSRGPDAGMDWARLAGNIVSPANIAIASKMPVAAGLAGRVGAGAGMGAAYGGMQPATQGDYWPEKAQQAGLGAVFGAALPFVGEGVARAVKPKSSAAVQNLMKEGVTPTIGQALGGTAKKAEEAARSMPFLGDAITAAHRRTNIDFNRAAINRALAPIGQKLGPKDPVGYGGVQKAYDTITSKYDEILPKLKIQADKKLAGDFSKIIDMADQMHPSRASQFKKIMENSVIGKFSSGKMHPSTYKEVDSQLGQIARDAMKSQDLDQRQLGAAISETQKALRAMMGRKNPAYAKDLKNVDRAYANLLRVENAASRQGAKGGIFTPNQLEAATRAMDTSLRKRASAHGKALMEDLGMMGDEVLAQKLASSGTADRAMWNIGGALSGVLSPWIPASLIGASGLYSPIAQKALTSAVASRPAAAQPIADMIRKASLLASPAAAPYGLLQNGK